MRVCVIGAGVVGCASAYELTRAGHEVILLDAACTAGTGTSRANGAQLSYSHVEPMAGPATMRALPGMLWRADSALELRLQWDTRQWAWLAQFAWACRSSQNRRGTQALLAIATLSRQRLEQWLETDALDIGLQRNGKLVLCADARAMRRQADLARLQAAAGVRQELLDRQACLAREPALLHHRGFVGGAWTAGDCAVDSQRYCTALVAAAARRGLETRFSARATRFVVEHGRVALLETDGAPVRADAYVLATGIDAPGLAHPLGERLPVYPVKGYSLTLRFRPGAVRPVTSVTDLQHKMVLAPLGGRLRVAAMAGIVGMDLTIPQAKVDQMVSTVQAIYPGLCDSSDPGAWAGLRPSTPTALPTVRQSRVSNVFLNVGHGALGLTLAAGCATQLAQAIEDAQLRWLVGYGPGSAGTARRCDPGAAPPPALR